MKNTQGQQPASSAASTGSPLMGIVRKWICKILHRRQRKWFWTEYSFYFWKCLKCGRHWKTPRTSHKYSPCEHRKVTVTEDGGRCNDCGTDLDYNSESRIWDTSDAKARRMIERSFDHLCEGENSKWRCRRCGEMVNMVKKTCGCKESPSPWEPVPDEPLDVTNVNDAAEVWESFRLWWMPRNGGCDPDDKDPRVDECYEWFCAGMLDGKAAGKKWELACLSATEILETIHTEKLAARGLATEATAVSAARVVLDMANVEVSDGSEPPMTLKSKPA